MAALQRQIHPMPDFVQQALVEADLMELYLCRPPYQRNDYIGWITRAKQSATSLKRLNQMLGELAAGNLYMGMDYHRKPR
jgi:uncharacterized protein YdeI (YjbR/CyaY-like superfamily)